MCSEALTVFVLLCVCLYLYLRQRETARQSLIILNVLAAIEARACVQSWIRPYLRPAVPLCAASQSLLVLLSVAALISLRLLPLTAQLMTPSAVPIHVPILIPIRININQTFAASTNCILVPTSTSTRLGLVRFGTRFGPRCCSVFGCTSAVQSN